CGARRSTPLCSERSAHRSHDRMGSEKQIGVRHVAEDELWSLAFFETELDAYFAVADRAAMQRHEGYREAAGKNQTLAEVGYATLQRYILEQIYTKHLSGEHLKLLESKLKLFRQRLDELQGLNRQKTVGEFAWAGTSTDRAFGGQPIQARQF